MGNPRQLLGFCLDPWQTPFFFIVPAFIHHSTFSGRHSVATQYRLPTRSSCRRAFQMGAPLPQG